MKIIEKFKDKINGFLSGFHRMKFNKILFGMFSKIKDVF